MQDRPVARATGLITERVDDDLVAYDQVSQMAHCLSSPVADVWERCDGNRSAAQIGRELDMESATVARALDELGDCGLLEDIPATRTDGISRREAALRFAKLGGAAVTAPLIYSVAIRPASAAASVCKSDGASATNCFAASLAKTTDTECCSGYWYGASSGNICVAADCVAQLGSCSESAPCCDGSCTNGTCGL